jgi:hypothetical protein
MPNRYELNRTPADQMTFKTWLIGTALFYGSIAAIAASFLIERHYASVSALSEPSQATLGFVAPAGGDEVPQQIWP